MNYYTRDWFDSKIKYYGFYGEEFIYSAYHTVLKDELIKVSFPHMKHVMEIGPSDRKPDPDHTMIIDCNDTEYYKENIKPVSNNITKVNICNLFSEKGGISNITISPEYIESLHGMITSSDLHQKNMAVSILFNLDIKIYKNDLKATVKLLSDNKNKFDSKDPTKEINFQSYLGKEKIMRAAYLMG